MEEAAAPPGSVPEHPALDECPSLPCRADPVLPLRRAPGPRGNCGRRFVDSDSQQAASDNAREVGR
jgi:hypothetical protein